MQVLKKTLYSVLEQAFLLPTYRYGYPQMLVADQDGQIEGIAVGYLHEQEAHIDDALKPLLPKLEIDSEFIAFFRHRNLCRRVVFRYASSCRDSAGTWDRNQIIKRSRYGCSELGTLKWLSLNVDQHISPRAKKLYERNGFLKTAS